MDKCRIVIWILGIIFFMSNILTPIFTIWTHISLEVLFYISLFVLCSMYIFILLIEISIYGKYLKNLKYKFGKHIFLFTLLFFFLTLCFFIILLINILIFQKFMRNCPFYLNKLDYALNFDRRCQLYDINYNSRFSYQYICSYESSKDFIDINEKKLKQKINPDNVICNKFIQLIDNTIINNFKEVYNKKDIFYCHRTNMPQENDYSFAKAKDCRKSKYNLMFSLVTIALFQYIYPMVFLRSFLKFRRNNFRDRNYRLGRAIFRLHDDLANLERFLNLIRNIVNLNNSNSSNNSTKISENPREDINFRAEKTVNIIIENKKEFIIDENIKNISSNKANQIDNCINSGNRNEEDFNSEERIIRNTNFKDNNINNHN